MIRVINIKENLPNVDYAIYLCDKEIEDSKILGNRVIIIIHGYGSSGVGGLIKKKLKNHLDILKKHRTILDYVPGEMWCESNEVTQLICKISPEAILNSNLQGLNGGVSVVLL